MRKNIEYMLSLAMEPEKEREICNLMARPLRCWQKRTNKAKGNMPVKGVWPEET